MLVCHYREILDYWFPQGFDANSETLRTQSRHWFRGGAEVDLEIRDRFSHLFSQAKRGELDIWAAIPRGRLALIIVLDQFSRSIYKGSPLAYAQDAEAQWLALDGMNAGMDQDLTVFERLFFVLPLGHSEDLDLQNRCVDYFDAELAHAPEHLRWWHEVNVYQSSGHRDVIARFGRHPHRNEILGRSSTAEELEYLRLEGPVHQRKTAYTTEQ
jgi:uncharacterized protein (DUF924 family)